jgi:hypothetical protein
MSTVKFGISKTNCAATAVKTRLQFYEVNDYGKGTRSLLLRLAKDMMLRNFGLQSLRSDDGEKTGETKRPGV